MITLVMRAGSDVNTQQVIELVQRTIGFGVQDGTEIAAGLASCKELIIPNLISSAAIAFAQAASKVGVQCNLGADRRIRNRTRFTTLRMGLDGKVVAKRISLIRSSPSSVASTSAARPVSGSWTMLTLYPFFMRIS